MDAQHAALHYVSDMDQYIVRDLGSATGVSVVLYERGGDLMLGVYLYVCVHTLLIKACIHLLLYCIYCMVS